MSNSDQSSYDSEEIIQEENNPECKIKKFFSIFKNNY